MLTERDIPDEVHVLHLEEGGKVKISLKTTTSARIVQGVFSLSFYLFFAAIAGYLIGSLIGSIATCKIVAVVVAAIKWSISYNRGSTLELQFAPPRHIFRTSTSVEIWDHLPDFQIKTERQKGTWISSLRFHDLTIATRASANSLEDAERPFRDFVTAMGCVIREIDEAQTEKTFRRETTQVPLLNSDCVPRTHDSELDHALILVHGTWGRSSKWADPQHSGFLKNLHHRFGENSDNVFVLVDRFSWSGSNSVNRRKLARNSLIELLKDKLNNCKGLVFVVAHSHGGNIALEAHDHLPDKESKERVRCICMATPFVETEYRFRLSHIYRELPRSLRDNLEPVLFWASWILAVLFSLRIELTFRTLSESLIYAFLSGNFHGGAFELLFLLLIFFGPPFVFMVAWKGAKFLLRQLPTDDRIGGSSNALSRRKVHSVVTSNADEAYQALSLVVNFFSIIHQTIFIAILFVSRGARKFRIYDAVSLVAELVFLAPFLVVCLVVIMYVLYTTIAGVFVPSPEEILPLKDHWEPMVKWFFEFALPVVFIIYMGTTTIVGGIILAVVGSMVLSGIVRIVVFSAIGVMGQLRDVRSLVHGLFGTVSVATIPTGCASTFSVVSGRWFNHTEIYSDPMVIDFIAAKMASDVLDFSSGGTRS